MFHSFLKSSQKNSNILDHKEVYRTNISVYYLDTKVILKYKSVNFNKTIKEKILQKFKKSETSYL